MWRTLIVNINKEIKDSAVDYSMNSIRHVCETIGPRESGMEAEYECQKFVQNELESNNWVDKTDIEPFKMARYGLLSFAPVIGVIMIFASLLQVVAHGFDIKALTISASVIFILLSILSLVIATFQFLLYKPFLDVFLPKVESHNLIAKIQPKEELKRRIVIAGHADSAYEFTIMKLHQTAMVVTIIINVVLLLLGVAISIAHLALKPTTLPIWSLVIFSISALFFISFFLLFNFGVVVPGANDNLTGVFLAVSVARCMKEAGIKLDNTEVQLLITGAEEAGLRGAFAWSKKYKPIYDAEEDVETVFIAFDTLHDYDWMTIYNREMSGITKNSKRAVKLVSKAAEELGVKLPISTIPAGASDAAAVSINGMHAACVAAQDPRGTRYYHNTRDNPDDMVPETFAFGLDIALKTIEVFDREGLPSDD